jgi:hypothetical protein
MFFEIITGTMFLFFAGVVGWKVLAFLRFPAPDLLGALFAGAVIGVAGWQIAFPANEVTFVCKLVIGSFIGLKVDRQVFREIRKILFPALLVSVWMLVLSIVSGYLLFWWTHLSLETSLLGSCTGGVTEMALMGFSFGADQVTITFLQLFRIVLFLLLMPIIVRFVSKWKKSIPSQAIPVEDPVELGETGKADPGYSGALRLALAALAGGLAGRITGIPAGAILGSMFSVGFFNVLRGGFPGVNPYLRIFARIGVGLAIAQEITLETVVMLSSMVYPVLIMAVVMILSSVLLSLVLYRITSWNFSTCLLASAPGGLTQMTMIADEVNADPIAVSILHTVRLVSVITILPLFMRFVLM